MEMGLKPKTKDLGTGLNRLPITMNRGGRALRLRTMSALLSSIDCKYPSCYSELSLIATRSEHLPFIIKISAEYGWIMLTARKCLKNYVAEETRRGLRAHRAAVI
jgi:hypothetical protein